MTRFALDQLDTLRTIVDEGTFEAAARRLHVTQSAVSQRIKQLERAAGQVLLRRSTPVETTEAGDVLLRHARQIDLLTSDALARLGTGPRDEDDTASNDPAPTTLPIAVNADSTATWFLDALAAVPPAVRVVFDLRRADQQHTAELLRSGDVLAAVTATREPVQGCSSEPLGVMRYRAVASPGFVDRWLAGVPHDPETPRLGRLDLAPLDRAPMVVFDRTDALQHDFVRRLTGREPLSPRHHVPASADFARAVVLGLGWGMLPEAQATPELDAGRLVELAPDDPVDVPLFWQRWTLASPLLDAVTVAVRTTARRALHP
ncbi:LysR family transcriptional regulator ArgP [Frigoribacterium sp. VKM Ac-2836]|uniref:LysR family transcriptional regulator ArgP n=1 Tax=Frigoribacterium sp. VKM Ac-2836 TaxID=2739014 RepID=UPI0015654422|nr:LysR family transcriptional regulator ArgP [Frigoribacterium sp. VKM Ac-2836]NRD26942.1 LysR family transcriptional regulator ArgP [Frigoribacterium sp. VKM Ac-2836]